MVITGSLIFPAVKTQMIVVSVKVLTCLFIYRPRKLFFLNKKTASGREIALSCLYFTYFHRLAIVLPRNLPNVYGMKRLIAPIPGESSIIYALYYW